MLVFDNIPPAPERLRDRFHLIECGVARCNAQIFSTRLYLPLELLLSVLPPASLLYTLDPPFSPV